MGRGSTPNVQQGQRASPGLALVMVVTMVVMPATMLVMVSVTMVVTVVMIMVMMPVPMIVVVDALVWAAAARVLAEHQRLDRHRHGVGRHADAAEIDIVEVPQHHAVDRENLALDQEFLAQDRAERLRDVAIKHDVERLAALDGDSEAVADAF